jgi:uncharacterized protein
VTTQTPYLPAEVAELFPDRISKEFWDRAQQHQLVFQQCVRCQTFRHPPAAVCHVCRSADVEWVEVAGRGTVFSYTIVTHGVHPALAGSLPFNVILVEFPDAPGVRLVSNLIDTPPDEVKVNTPVEVVWEDLASGATLPRFRRV